ncbi:MAG TPA: DUF934 domain-containing protein [Steroidobacteraceae bacterium]|nr:DUF934 domain-containing protein [Steroidobacteraceae bacterium]
MPRKLLLDGRVVVDEWRRLAEAGAPEPGMARAGDDGSALLLTLDEWLSDRDRWLKRRGRLGVILAPAHKVERIAPDLARFDLVAAEFPNPSDGRGYTQGRQLREQRKFAGELRAIGYVRRDQLFFLARCGFNSFELPESELDGARAGFSVFSAAYQPANEAGLAVALRRC